MMNFEPGDLFVFQDEYKFRRGCAQCGLVLNVIGRIHHDIDDICLTVLINGQITEEWASFLMKLNH